MIQWSRQVSAHDLENTMLQGDRVELTMHSKVTLKLCQVCMDNCFHDITHPSHWFANHQIVYKLKTSKCKGQLTW